MATTRVAPEFMELRQEAELTAASQMGDRASFMKLVAHYHRSIYRLAYGLCRRDDEAASLTEETFARAWSDIAEYPSGRRFFPWILRILKNLPRKVAPAGAEAEDTLVSRIGALRNEDRLALALRVVEGFGYQDIAALLDVPTGIVILRIAQARGSLLTGNPEGRPA